MRIVTLLSLCFFLSLSSPSRAKEYLVKGLEANVYSEPGGKFLDTVPFDATIRSIVIKPHWVQVRYSSNKRIYAKGWIRRNELKPKNPEQTCYDFNSASVCMTVEEKKINCPQKQTPYNGCELQVRLSIDPMDIKAATKGLLACQSQYDYRTEHLLNQFFFRRGSKSIQIKEHSTSEYVFINIGLQDISTSKEKFHMGAVNCRLSEHF